MTKIERLERRVSIWDDGDEELAKVNMTLDGLTVKQLLAVVRAADDYKHFGDRNKLFEALEALEGE